MARWVQRVGFALAGALLALGPSPAAVHAAPSAPPTSAGGACTDSTGITVVVDFTRFGGGVEVRCATQPVRSGFEALTRAGFAYQGTARFPGLLCRIDGEPATDPCQGAPPPNALLGLLARAERRRLDLQHVGRREPRPAAGERRGLGVRRRGRTGDRSAGTADGDDDDHPAPDHLHDPSAVGLDGGHRAPDERRCGPMPPARR